MCWTFGSCGPRARSLALTIDRVLPFFRLGSFLHSAGPWYVFFFFFFMRGGQWLPHSKFICLKTGHDSKWEWHASFFVFDTPYLNHVFLCGGSGPEICFFSKWYFFVLDSCQAGELSKLNANTYFLGVRHTYQRNVLTCQGSIWKKLDQNMKIPLGPPMSGTFAASGAWRFVALKLRNVEIHNCFILFQT